MTKHSQSSTSKRLPRDPQQLLTMGLRLGNAITKLVFDKPLSEREVPEPLPCSRCAFTLRRGGRS